MTTAELVFAVFAKTGVTLRSISSPEEEAALVALCDALEERDKAQEAYLNHEPAAERAHTEELVAHRLTLKRAEAAEAEVERLNKQTQNPGACMNCQREVEALRAKLVKVTLQKGELIAARVELIEALGATARLLYLESAKERPAREALRAEAKRLDGFLLQHRTIHALASVEQANEDAAVWADQEARDQRAKRASVQPLLLGHTFEATSIASDRVWTDKCAKCGQPENAHRSGEEGK